MSTSGKAWLKLADATLPDPVTAKDLAAATGLTPSATGCWLRRREAAGRITRLLRRRDDGSVQYALEAVLKAAQGTDPATHNRGLPRSATLLREWDMQTDSPLRDPWKYRIR